VLGAGKDEDGGGGSGSAGRNDGASGAKDSDGAATSATLFLHDTRTHTHGARALPARRLVALEAVAGELVGTRRLRFRSRRHRHLILEERAAGGEERGRA